MDSVSGNGNSIEKAELTDLTAHIVGAYVANNPMSPGDLPRIISDVHAALSGLGRAPAGQETEQRTPAVPIRKSVQPDAITCLECGKKFRTIKRHLMTYHQLTPQQYRANWNLPYDYPMVAPAYSATRSSLAKSLGLGRKPAAKKGGRRRSR